jgi:hypothetical protein
MASRHRRERAAVGVTVKSGWACAVLLAGPAASPRVVEACRVDLSDPEDPDARQPYHAGFGTARGTGRELSRLVSSVKRFGRTSMTTLIRRYERSGTDVRGAGVVAGSLIDPDTIGNDHIRIHALEGQLFRTIIEEGLAAQGLSCSVWRQRDLNEVAMKALALSDSAIRARLAALGHDVDGPWRAEQKAAALAAWIVLAGRRAQGGT